MSVRSDQVSSCVISPTSKEFYYVAQFVALAFLLSQELYITYAYWHLLRATSVYQTIYKFEELGDERALMR